jgi:hypothetical protein
MSDNRRECADEILTLCQRRWARREAEPVLIEDVLPILAKHFPPAVPVSELRHLCTYKYKSGHMVREQIQRLIRTAEQEQT